MLRKATASLSLQREKNSVEERRLPDERQPQQVELEYVWMQKEAARLRGRQKGRNDCGEALTKAIARGMGGRSGNCIAWNSTEVPSSGS
jgi:hypothetical protein